MSKKVTNASKHPVAIRLVKRAGASVGFSDGIKPAGAVDDSIELSFNLGGYTPDEGRFVIGTSATPNIKNPQTYVNNGEQFKIVNESNRLLIEADITTHDTDPNYSSLTFGIFFRLKNTDGDYVMSSPRTTQAVVDYKNVKTQVEKTVIKQSVGQWFNDSNYYVPLYLGTLKELLTHWANTTGMGMPELQTLGSKSIYNKVGLTVDLPLTSVTITNVGDFEIGTTVAIEHTFTPAIAKVTNVQYSVSDPTIAEFVGTTNQLQIKSMGSVDVTVTLTDNIGNEMSTTKTFNTVLDFVPLIASYAVNNSLVSLNIAAYVKPTGYVDWGDGTLEPVTTGALSHQYVGAGQRDVTLWVETPILNLQFVAGNALTEVKQWGDVTFPVVALAGNTELVKVPNQIPKGLTDAASMFEGCVKFNQSLNGWDVSGVVNMTNMFKGASTFNGLIDAWDVSNVVAFERMFEGAVSFNRNINTWVMSAARNLTYMFKGAAQYNQPIAAWRLPLTDGTVNVSGMFEGATSFNQSIVGFVNTNVAYLGGMFKGCSNFNQPVSGVAFAADAQIQGMFEDCISFNSSVGNFNGAKPTNLRDLFKGCSNFNQTLVGLDMSECTVAESFLEGCARFNQPLTDMDVSNLNNATNMFKGCAIFTSDLSNWDVSNLHQANGMFNGTTNFDSDLGWWCVSNLQSEPVDFATGSFLARSNYPKWGTCPVRDVSLTIDNETPFLNVGSTGTMTYTANKTITEESVVWSSSNPSAVTINETTGEYAVIDAGGATITVTVNGIYTTTRTYEAVPAITPAVMVVAQHADPLTIRLDSDTTRTSEAYVDWGDGTFDRLTSINSLSKTYTTAGPFNVSVIPTSPIGSSLVINGDGVTALTAFGECDISINSSNLESVPASLPSNVTSFGFQDCVKLNDPNISNWNVSNIKNFSGMFAGAIAFNQPLDNWVMTQATDLSWMFGSEDGVGAFNQNIAGWDVSNVTNLNGMFYNAASFNQDIGTWSVSKVTDMGDMFHGAAAMVADLSWWCVSTITETPTDFATSSGLTDGNFPYWGTCPIRTAVATIDSPQVVNVGDTFAFSYTLTPAFTPGKVEWTTTTPSLVTLDVATGIATVIGDGQANLTVTVNDKIIGIKQFTAMPLFTPLTMKSSGGYYSIRAMKDSVVVKIDGVVITPPPPFEGEPEDEEFDYYFSETMQPDLTITVSPIDSVSPLASIRIDGGISEVVEWCSLGHVIAPGQTEAAVRLTGTEIVSVPDYLPAEMTDLNRMFSGAVNFNSPNIVNWDLSNVTSLDDMFSNALAFNQPIGNWDVSNVTRTIGMFAYTSKFNQDLSSWDVSKVTTMRSMFWSAKAFNQPLNDWDVSNVINFGYMFARAVYNQPLDNWVTTSATDMSGMFDSAEFNQPIGKWSVSKVTNMSSMFKNCTAFNQDLSGWCVTNITSKPEDFNSEGAALQSVNQPFWGTCPIAGAVVTITVPPTANVEDTIPLSYVLTPEFTAGKVEWSTTTPDLVLIDTVENTLLIVDHGEIELTVTVNNKITSTTTIAVAAPMVPFTATTTGTTLAMTAPQDTVKLFVDDVEVVPTGSGQVSYSVPLDGTPKTVKITPFLASGKLGNFQFSKGLGLINHWGDYGYEPNEIVRLGKDIVGVPNHAPPGLKKFESLFNGATDFNDPNIVDWDVSEVTDMTDMFRAATAFNQPIGVWDVSNVTNFSRMFDGCLDFDQPIGNWDTSNGVEFDRMFADAMSFNHPIGDWNVSATYSMNSMFNGATLFNQNLNWWCLTNITSIPQDFKLDSALTEANLPTWGACPSRTAVTLISNIPPTSIVGDNYNLEVSVMDNSTPIEVVTEVWSVSDSNKAIVTEVGEITLLAPGEVTVKVRVNGVYTAETTLTIEPPPPTPMTLETTGTELEISAYSPIVVTIEGGATFTPAGQNEGGLAKYTLIHTFPDNAPRRVTVASVNPANPITSVRLTKGVSKVIDWCSVGHSTIVQGITTLSNVGRLPATITQVPAQLHPSITNLSNMFGGAVLFNQDISGWDTSNVTNMASMFSGAKAFNQNISGWDTSNVTNMSSMFAGNSAFDQPLNSWNTSKVTDMSGMFVSNSAFNQNISGWDTSNVTNMASMFASNSAFDQPLDSWNTSNVTTMANMFNSNNKFNKPIGNWDTSKVTNMSGMFVGAKAFDQPLDSWNTSNVTTMASMFNSNNKFNKPIGNWDTSKVTDMSKMFASNTAFDQPLNSWNTSKVTNMSWMFNTNNKFDKPIGNWDTSKVTNMASMFQGSTYLDRQNLSQWCVGQIPKTPSNFCPNNYSYQNWPVWGTCPPR